MGSKGRIPPPHLRRPLPGPGMMHPDPFGPGMMHPDPFGPGIRPPPGAFPPFDMLPPPEIMEQKLAAQHGEMQRLATENQRLAATHVALRQELAAAQQELQRLQAQIAVMKNDKEQHMRGLMDKISKMEVDLQATEPVKMDLQQARAEAQSLVAARQDLISKVQQLSQDHQRTLLDCQHIPALMSELDGLRQEYQHYRATYDYEKKLYNDHLESLQLMEKNYISMAREVEKLRAELANNATLEGRTGAPYGAAATGYKENEAAGHHPVGQNAYEDGYSVPQGRAPPTVTAAPYGGGAAAVAAPYGGGSAAAPAPAPAAGRAGYEAAQRGPAYDPSRVAGYDAASRGTGYDAQPRTQGYGAARGAAGPPQGQQAVAPGNNAPYGSATPPTRPGGGGAYEAQPRGGNPVRR